MTGLLAHKRPVDVPLDPLGKSPVSVQYRDSAPFWRSIRFRLTAWYALVMLLVILGISLALHTLLDRTLEQDAQQRLSTAGAEIARGTRVTTLTLQGPYADGSARFSIEIDPPDEAALVLSGLWYQYYDMQGQPYLTRSGTDGGGVSSLLPSEIEKSFANQNVFQQDSAVMTTVTIDGEESLVLITPLSLNIDGDRATGVTPGWLVVGEPLGSRAKLTGLADQSLLLFGMAGVVFAALGGWLIAGRALAPVERITESANAIATGADGMNFSRRVEVPEDGDELNRLARTFNEMLDRIEAAFRTQQRFVADASHELRSPLTAVRGNVQVLIRQIESGRPVDPTDIVDDLRIVQRESSRMGRLIEDLLTLARTDVSSLGELIKAGVVNLDDLAHEALQIAKQLANGQDIRLRTDSPVVLMGDKDRLVQVMIILLENAIRHTPPDGIVSLTIDRAIDPESQVACARISVADTGVGIEAEHIPHLFERFYRVEKARTRNLGGTGLGLSIALAVVRAHGGWIDVDSEPGEGTTFTVWLPIVSAFDEDTFLVDSNRLRRAIRFRRPRRLQQSSDIEAGQLSLHNQSDDSVDTPAKTRSLIDGDPT